MKREAYQKPTMTVVMLQECDILAASKKRSRGEGFNWDDDD